MEQYKAQLGASNAHCTIVRSEIGDLCLQLTNEISKKQQHSSTKIKSRFLMQKSLQEEFEQEEVERKE